MFRGNRLRTVLLCLGLEVVALLGVPTRPDEIEDLLRKARHAKIEFQMRKETEDSEDLLRRRIRA